MSDWRGKRGAADWLSRRVRVWSAQGRDTTVLAEGVVVGYAPHPTILVRADDGTQADWQVTLPIDVLEEQAEIPARFDQEARDRELLARHFRVLASAVNVDDWPAYIKRVAAGHEAGTSWYRP